MASKRPLTISLRTYGHTADIKSGAIQIPDTPLEFIEVVPQVAAFRRMVRDFEFDICELAPTTYFIARAYGPAPYTALPIFFERRFHHGGLVARADSGINKPKDLEGKKVGVRSYSGTTGVWTRGVYANEFGVDLSKCTWVVDDEEHVTALRLPPYVMHVERGRLPKMMASGEIQAGFLSRADKARNDGHAGLGRAGDSAETATYHDLVENPFEAGVEWYGRTGVYPMHSLLVVKNEVLDERPDLPKQLYDAFVKSRQTYYDRLASGAAAEAIDNRYRKQQQVVGADVLPYGVAKNIRSLDMLMTYAEQQGLVPQRLPVAGQFIDPS